MKLSLSLIEVVGVIGVLALLLVVKVPKPDQEHVKKLDVLETTMKLGRAVRQH
eukprot:Pgem_evm1s1274